MPINCLLRVGIFFLLAYAAIATADVSAPGTLIVLNKSDNSAMLFNLGSGTLTATLPTGHAPHEAAVSPDGRTLVVTNYGDRVRPGNSLTIIDLASKAVTKTIDLGKYERPHGVAFMPDGKRVLVTVEENRALITVDIQSGDVEQAIGTDQSVSHMVARSPDAKRAFVANIDSGSMTAVDLAKGQRIANVPTGEGAEGIAVTPDGKELWVTNRGADTITVLDPDTLTTVATLPSASFPIRIIFSHDGRYALVSNAKSGDVAVFDVKQRKEVRRVRLEISAVDDQSGRLFRNVFGSSPVPIGVLAHPDNRHAFVALSNADRVIVFDMDTGRILGEYATGTQPDGLAYTPLE